MPTPILQLPLVAPNQNQKETTINTALAILEGAGNDARVIDASGDVNLTLSQNDFTRYMAQRVQGNTVAINVAVPALKRFFVVFADGAAPVTFHVTGQVPTTHGAEVPAGTLALLMSDGVNVRALSSGVTQLQDLTDVVTTPVVDGQVLAYILAENKWRPATIAEVLNVAFTSLTDAPSSYTGHAGKLVRVKAGQDGVEFVAPADVAGASAFTGLDDAPSTYVGQALRYVRVNADATGLEFVEMSELDFTALNDAPASYEGHGGKVLTVRMDETGVEFTQFNDPSSFLGLSDTPADYTGQAGKIPSVKATEDGLEFVDPPSGGGGATTFAGLTDTPADYTGQTGKLVAVKATEDGVEFVDPPSGGSVAVEEDGNAVEAAAGSLNFTGAMVSVTTDGAGNVTVTIDEAADAAGAHLYWRIRGLTAMGGTAYLSIAEIEFRATLGGADQSVGGTAIESSHYSTFAAAQAFDNSNATFWTSNTGDLGSGDGAWVGYQFAAPVVVQQVALTAMNLPGEAFKSGFVEYSDDGVSWSAAWELPTQTAAWANGETRTFDSPAALPDFLKMGDTPDTYVGQANRKVRVKAAEDGLEFVEDTFLSQSDTPAAYTGQAKKRVRVNAAATALEFAGDEVDIIGSKAAAYTATAADANGVIPVNVAATVDVTIPSNATVAFPVGTQISVLQSGAAQVGVVGDAGVTVNRPAALTNLTREQHSVVTALKLAADTWVLLGDLAPNP